MAVLQREASIGIHGWICGMRREAVIDAPQKPVYVLNHHSATGRNLSRPMYCGPTLQNG